MCEVERLCLPGREPEASQGQGGGPLRLRGFANEEQLSPSRLLRAFSASLAPLLPLVIPRSLVIIIQF
jgi:hypothetical protein